MQPAWYAFLGLGVVVLDEFHLAAHSLIKHLAAEALKEETPRITKHARFKNQHLRNICFNNVHLFATRLFTQDSVTTRGTP